MATNAADDVVGRVHLAPSPELVKSLGANHTLESALADLVDNSVDAKATSVSIRLLTRQDRLVQVEVLDNGRGMSSQGIDEAMTVGRRRAYSETDLGHFGVGLKAASFGHSEVLTVWSTSAGPESVGRRIRRAEFAKDFTCEVLSPIVAAEHAARRAAVTGGALGTSVVWTVMRNVYGGSDRGEAAEWLDKRKDSLRLHLGLTFHRLLTDGRLQIDVLVDELSESLDGIAVEVLPIDPFGYGVSGHPGYPKQLTVMSGDEQFTMTCHMWPGKSDVTGFRLGTKSGEDSQGFFIYRNDRLLQTGGWADIATTQRTRQLARVLLDDTRAVGKFLTMNPEKSGLRFEPNFHDAVHHATAQDGTSFADYLNDAESVYVESRKRKRGRKPMIEPGKGFAPGVRKTLDAELSFRPGPPLDLKWRPMPDGEFLDVDFTNRTLWLNKRYRQLLVSGHGGLNDAPLLKAALYLLTHEVFEGLALGSMDKDHIALWKSVLGAAVAAEDRMRGE